MDITIPLLGLGALVLLSGNEEAGAGNAGVVNAVKQAIASKMPGGSNCWDWCFMVYQMAGYGGPNKSLKNIQVLFKGNQYLASSPYTYLPLERYSELQAGDWIYVHNSNSLDAKGNHSDIFLEWADFSAGLANNASSPGYGSPGRYNKRNLQQQRIAWWMRPK